MIVLTEAEQLGIKIVAWMRHGELQEFKCHECVSFGLQEERNCTGVEEHSVPVRFVPLIGTFYACPMTFISPAVQNFFNEYDYYEKYPAKAPSYNDVNPRYWASVSLYESFMYDIQQYKNNNEQKDDTDNLSRMSALFKK